MMNPASERVILAKHATAHGEIQLQQRLLADGTPAFEIISNGVFLMAGYNQVSERALARLTLARLPHDTELKVLVGGLGMGFTLQETLAHNAAVTVIEISPHIIDWNRSYFSSLNGQALSDPRVKLIQDDIYALLSTTSAATYHAILLDVDNGPSWLARPGNARLYTLEALTGWAKRLRPGGCLSVWSAQAEPEFLSRLRATFPHVQEVCLPVPGPKKEPIENFIYRACK